MTKFNRNHFQTLLSEIVKSARMEGEHAETPITYILENRTENLVDVFMRELDQALKPIKCVEVPRDSCVKLVSTNMRIAKRKPAVILDHTSTEKKPSNAPKVHVIFRDVISPEFACRIAAEIRTRIIKLEDPSNAVDVREVVRTVVRSVYKHASHRTLYVVVLLDGATVYATKIPTEEIECSNK